MKTVVVCFLGVVGCGLEPTFVSRQGVSVYVTHGAKITESEVEDVIDALAMAGATVDAHAGFRYPRELHVHRGLLISDGEFNGGYYDSLLNAVHVAELDRLGCRAPWGHEWSHWLQDATGREVGHNEPYFASSDNGGWSELLQAEAEEVLCE